MRFDYFRSGIETLDSLLTSENQVTEGLSGGFRYFTDGQKGSLYMAIEGVPGSAKSMLALQIMACRVASARKACIAERQGCASQNSDFVDGPTEKHRGGVFFVLEHDAQAIAEIIARFKWMGEDPYKGILIYKAPRNRSNQTASSGWFEITASVGDDGVSRIDRNGKPILQLQQISIEPITKLRWWLFIVEIPPNIRDSMTQPREGHSPRPSEISQRDNFLPNADVVDYFLSELLCNSRTPAQLHANQSTIDCERLITANTDLVVLDSLPAFLAAFGHGKALRNTLADARQKMAADGRHLIIITELSLEESSSAPFLDREEVFLPDVVLRLGFWRGDDPSTGQRYLEVRKARYQAFPTGRHELSILGPQTTSTRNPDARGPLMSIPSPTPGININASLAWKLDVWAAEKKYSNIAMEQHADTCSLGIPSLDRQIDSRNSCGIPKGTSIGIIAEHGAGSTAIGLHFLAEGLQRAKGNENCLLISFDHDEEGLKRKINKYEFLRKNLLSGPSNDHWAPGFYVHTRMLARLPAERLIQRIQEFLDAMAHRKTPITRVMVDSLGAYRARYPLLASSELFPNALVRLFSSRRVTSAIVDIVHSAVDRDFQNASSSAIETLTDTVISIGHVTLQGRNCRAVLVRQSASGTPSDEVHELHDRYAVAGPSFDYHNRTLQIPHNTQPANCTLAVSRDRFETYTGIFSKHPSPVPLRLVLYTDSLNPMSVERDHPLSPVARYKRGLVETLTIGMPQVTAHFFGPSIHSNACGAIHAFGEAPRTDTCVVEFDGHWLRELEANHLIIPTSRKPSHEGTDDFLRFPHTEHSSFVPHYVDLGLFVERIAAPPQTTSHSSGCASRFPPSWAELASIAQERHVARMTLEQWNDNPFFDFDRTVPEAMCCMLLELLLAFLKPIRDRWEDNNASSEPVQRDLGPLAANQRWLSAQRSALPLKIWFPETNTDANSLVIKAILTFKALYPNSPDTKSAIANLSKTNRSAIWQRQWFSTLYSGITRNEGLAPTAADGKHSDYRVYRGMPAHSDKDKYSNPVAGTWHLGIVSGSASPRLAWRVVNEITGIAADYTKLSEGVGLPCRNAFYESDAPNFFPSPILASPSPREIRTVYLESFSRSWISHYRQITPILLRGFQELILADEEPEAVEGIVRRTQAQIDLAYSMLPKSSRDHPADPP